MFRIVRRDDTARQRHRPTVLRKAARLARAADVGILSCNHANGWTERHP
jgi:hypothetical protein